MSSSGYKSAETTIMRIVHGYYPLIMIGLEILPHAGQVRGGRLHTPLRIFWRIFEKADFAMNLILPDIPKQFLIELIFPLMIYSHTNICVSANSQSSGDKYRFSINAVCFRTEGLFWAQMQFSWYLYLLSDFSAFIVQKLRVIWTHWVLYLSFVYDYVHLIMNV